MFENYWFLKERYTTCKTLEEHYNRKTFTKFKDGYLEKDILSLILEKK